MKYSKWLIVICIPMQCVASLALSDTSPALKAQKSNILSATSDIPQFTLQPTTKEPAPAPSEIRQSSLETLDIDASGNWLEKRYWYQKAEKTYELIKTTVAQIIDTRTQFYDAVHGVGQQLDNFYETVNFDKGQVDRILQDALQQTDAIKDERGDLSAKERNIKRGLQEDQKQLETLGKIIKNIHDLDTQAEQVFAQALHVIDDARKYESQAWESFKKIGYELDDKKAEAEYYNIDSYYQNAQQVLHYLQNQLMGYLHQNLVQKITEHMSKVQNILQELKKKDLDIVSVINKQRSEDIQVEKQRQKEAIELGVQDQEDKLQEKRKADEKAMLAHVSWYQSTLEWLKIGWQLTVVGIHDTWNAAQEKMMLAYSWILSWVKK